MNEKPPCPARSRARESKAVQVQAVGRRREALTSNFDWGGGGGGCGFREGTPRLQGPTLSPLPSSTQVVKGTRCRRPQPLPAPSRLPRLSGLGALRRTRLLGPGPKYRFRSPERSPHAPDRPALGSAKRPRRAPPAPPGKMAPAEQLRHQPWRRARPSAILAPSSCHPPTPTRTTPARSCVRDDPGREPRRARALSAKRVPPSLSCLRTGRAGPAGGAWLGQGSSARHKGSSGPGRGSSAVLWTQAAKRWGRASPAGRRAPRTGPDRAGEADQPRALPAAAARTSSGKEEARMKNKPRAAAAASLPPAPLPLSRRGVHFAEKKENAIHTQELPRERRNEGGKTEGRRLEKLIFLPRSPSLLALPAPAHGPAAPSSLRRAPLPPSRLPAAPGGGGGGGGGGKHTLTRAHN